MPNKCFKSILNINKTKYIKSSLLIMIVYVLCAIVTTYIDNAIIMFANSSQSNFHSLFISIRFVFLISAISLVMSQSYNIMSVGIKDQKNVENGLSDYNIQTVILVQVLHLLLITPIGLLCGFIISGMILNNLSVFALSNTREIFMSANTNLMVLAGIAAAIISMGLYISRELKK